MLSNVSSSSNSSNNLLCGHIFSFKIKTLSRCIVQIALMFPMALYVLYHGYQRWKPNKNISHSDFFTYNMALVQLINVSETLVSTYGVYILVNGVVQAGEYLWGLHFVAELLIHCLTCVDRYLAIVKPIFYLKFKQSLGLVIRNVLIGIVWLLSFGYMSFHHYYYPSYPIHLFIGTLIFTVFIVSFCSIYVLCVLIRPGPGDGGQNKMDQSKLKAFQTILAIMAVVLIWVLGVIVFVGVEGMVKINKAAKCTVIEVIIWFSLPSSLVLLVLYLQRAVKCTASSK